jgi:hypothetical protein
LLEELGYLISLTGLEKSRDSHRSNGTVRISDEGLKVASAETDQARRLGRYSVNHLESGVFVNGLS